MISFTRFLSCFGSMTVEIAKTICEILHNVLRLLHKKKSIYIPLGQMTEHNCRHLNSYWLYMSLGSKQIRLLLSSQNIPRNCRNLPSTHFTRRQDGCGIHGNTSPVVLQGSALGVRSTGCQVIPLYFVTVVHYCIQ